MKGLIVSAAVLESSVITEGDMYDDDGGHIVSASTFLILLVTADVQTLPEFVSTGVLMVIDMVFLLIMLMKLQQKLNVLLTKYCFIFSNCRLESVKS